MRLPNITAVIQIENCCRDDHRISGLLERFQFLPAENAADISQRAAYTYVLLIVHYLSRDNHDAARYLHDGHRVSRCIGYVGHVIASRVFLGLTNGRARRRGRRALVMTGGGIRRMWEKRQRGAERD